MSELSPRLSLPFLMPAQAQKHVTHNEALEQLDMLVQLTVVGFEATTPPANPVDGQVWALGAAPLGAWAGQGGRLAVWRAGGWVFVTPAAGWRAALGTTLRLFDGSAWVDAALPPLQNLDGVGINTSHDATNRLSVAAPATLLTHDGADHQLKINKAAMGDTASLLFQTGFSGRAEMGLAGQEDFTLKVSANGADWQDGLVVARTSGQVQAPNGLTVAGQPAVHLGNLLGSVGQNMGVPTGAVLERGSTANGAFLRLADGTQICWHWVNSSSVAAVDWTYPVAFVGAVVVQATPSWDGGACLAGTESTSATAASFSVRDLSGARIARACALMAMGHWV